MAAKQTKTKQGEALRKQGAAWLDRIKAATKAEKEWMDDAEKATKAYTGETKGQEGVSAQLGKTYDFNILFSNVETIVPAVINSPPAPDIRRRFADDDPAAKDVSELLERAIRIQIDDSKLQVELEAEAQDIFLAGRGVIRLRFKSDFVKDAKDELETGSGGQAGSVLRAEPDSDGYGADQSMPMVAQPGGQPGPAPAPAERLANERITFEAVSWRDYRHGPAKRWDERPWEAFRFCITREDEAESFDSDLIQTQLDENEYKTRSGATDELTGWEIWCKKTRKVHFVDEDGIMLKTVDDPLDLTQFFSTATPAQAIEVTGRLKPVNPFSIYSNLADELDLTTKRINLITDEMRVKGWYSGDAGDIANMLNAKDVEFVPIKDAEIWAQNGGLANAVAWWPIEKFVVVLKELYAAREQTKQAIYEITGISDIVRGASKSNETLGAQQIKTQWGSLRIQKMQRMLERTARDLFVMMAEIIPSKFSFETLQKMTGIQLIPTEQDMTPVVPPQVPQMPEGAPPEAQQQAQEAEKARLEKLAKMQAIQKLLNEPLAMMYRIDVESDSTVKADLSRQKAESAEFLTGAASYFQAVGPLVQEGAMPMDAAVEIFAANARLFNLGKSVEDTLDKMITDAKAKAGQPAPPNPEQQKAEAEAKAREQEAQQKAADRQADMQAKQQDAEAKAQERADTRQMKREEHDFKMQEMAMDQKAKLLDLQAKGEDRQFQRENEAEKMGFEREKHTHAMQAKKADTDGKRAEMGLPSDEMTEAFTGLVKSVADSQEKMAQAIDKLATAQLAPKSITTPDGRTFTAKTTVN